MLLQPFVDDPHAHSPTGGLACRRPDNQIQHIDELCLNCERYPLGRDAIALFLNPCAGDLVKVNAVVIDLVSRLTL
jgi:hypothetical protein